MFRSGRLGFISDFLGRAITPIWKTEIAFTDVFLKEVFTSKKDLIRQNEILKNRLNESEIKLLQASLLEKENESLKEIFLRSTGENNIIATILAKPNQSLYGTLIIDVGEEDGVKIDDLVFALGNVVIGEIESVDKNSSKVILYSSPGYISQVTLENTGRYFNAKGRGAGDFEIQFPRELDVEVGQIFLYPSINNYLVGVVENVLFDPRDSYKKVLFRSAANIQELKWVQVRI
ncbi:MAG: rod shape-determining protein MreC [Candidatus Paceibacterota bacterium]